LRSSIKNFFGLPTSPYPTCSLPYSRRIVWSLGTGRSAAYLASGSVLDAGVGYNFNEIKTNAWIGIGTHPQLSTTQIIAELESEVGSHLRMKGSFNFGIGDIDYSAQEPPEFGFSLGLLFRIR
jgi:hypothetical protein